MDDYTRKRSAGGFGFLKRGSSLALRDTNHEDRNIQSCNRLGCSTRLNSMKGAQIGTLEKPKHPKASFRSMGGKAIVGSSSKPFAASADSKKSHQERPPRSSFRSRAESSSSQRTVEESESSSQQGETDGSEFSLTSTGIQMISHDSEDLGSPTIQEASTTSSEASSSRSSIISSEASSSRSHRHINRRMGSNSQDIPSSSSSVRHSISSKSMGMVAKPSSQYMGYGPPKYGLKNLSCSSISDILPSGLSSSDLGHNRKASSVRKRPSIGESSSNGAKSMSGSSSSSFSSPSGSLISQQASRRARNRSTSRDGPVSVRTRRAPSEETRVRLLEQEDDSIVLVSEPTLYPQLPHSQFEAVPENSSRSLPMESPSVLHNTFGGRLSSSGRSARNRSISSRPEDNGMHTSFTEREGYRRFNVEGIAEVLLALETIEQDDELTYEQLLVLETNLFLGGFSFHDQHREMRLDIDNMTYEELLVLEEKMGTVSTALSEDALSRCLKKSIYFPPLQFPGTTARGDDDIKCSICQEEYVVDEEVGRLACGHRYHADCICQWLRQKNWCPICKASAASSSGEAKN